MSHIYVSRAEGADQVDPSLGMSNQMAQRRVVGTSVARGRPTPRLAALDGMRLLAALAVMGFHYIAAGPANFGPIHAFPRLEGIFAYGWLGVNLFFLISGFVICMSSWGRGLGEFFVSRVVRLYPAYWVGILLTTVVVGLLPGPIYRQRWSQVLVNLTMLQHPLHANDVDASYWTLWRELMFYLLFAIVVWRGVTYRRAVLFCALWTVASVIAVSLSVPALSDVVGSEYSMYFVAGIAMYLMHRYRPTALLWCIVGCCCMMAVYNLPPRLAYLSPGLGRTLSLPVAAALVLLCFLMVLAAALGWLTWARWRWLTVAGALTYPLYLIHQSIGYNVMRWLAPHVDRHLLLGGLVLTMLGLAWLIHRCVERPLAPLLKRGLQRSVSELRPSRQETTAVNGAVYPVRFGS